MSHLLSLYDQYASPAVEDFDRHMVDSMRLSVNGNDKERIGEENTRKENNFIKEAEDLLEKYLPLPLTCDIRPLHPPYFREFSYTDMMGGILFGSLSAEVSARIREEASRLPANGDFPLELVTDKYQMGAPARQSFRKVLFLPGSNLLEVLDSSKMTEIIFDDEWVIKPHPVSSDGTIKDIITMFGGDRILPKKMSGHGIFEKAEIVATTGASEFALKAVLAGKTFINVTAKNHEDSLTYGAFTRLLVGDKEADWKTINNALMSDLSGYLLESNGTGRNKDLIKMFAGRAMEIRSNFKMRTAQRLVVQDLYPKHWIARPERR